MKLHLSRTMIATLNDLYEIAEKQADVFFPAADVHHSTLTALENRGLVVIKKRTADGRTIRHVALTTVGIELLIKGVGINAKHLDEEPKRQRFTVGVQLDMEKADHRFAMGQVDRLKSERRFTPTFIQLLQLNEELERGDVNQFKSAYPDAYEALRKEFESQMLYQQFASYMNKLEELKATVTAQVPIQESVGLQPMGNQSGGLQTIPVKQLAAPNYDDEDDEDLLIVTKDTTAGGKSAQAFLDSIMKLQEK